MGDHAANIYIKPHRRVGSGLIGIALGKHLGAGNPIVWSIEIPPSMYDDVRAAALQSQSAFDSAAATAWGSWYGTNMATGEEKAEARGHVLDYAP
jgi:hypothetical protein